MFKKYKFILPILGIIILIIPVFFGLFHKGFFISDDGNWMVIRFSAFYEALRSGQFPVRFLPRLNNGYGYPVADFLYPLFMYIAFPIKAVGFSFVNSIKIVFGLSFLFSAISTFFWLRKFFNNFSSMIGAIAYVLFPYHLFDIYSRGSVGEALSFSIIPFILWQIERKSYLLISIGVSLIILAHNTLALLFMPLFLIYFFLKPKKNYLIFILSIFLGVLMSSFFWLPALYDKQFTVFDTTSVSNFNNYFISQQSLTLVGFISILSIFFGIILFFKKRDNNLLFFLILTLASILLSLSFSKVIWDIIPGKNLIQFPFRLLSIACLSSAYLISAFIESLKKFKFVITILIFIFIYFSGSFYIYPKNFQDYQDGYYSTNMDTTTVKNEYMPTWVRKQNLSLKKQSLELVNGKGAIIPSFLKGTNILNKVNLSEDSILQLNFIYYPGWKIWIDNKEANLSYNNDYGLTRFTVSSGEHLVLAKFTETPLRLFADLISILGLMIALFIFLRKKYV